MDELVDILDKEGNNTGKTCMKSEAHLNGYWHPCIHVWLYTDNGEVLIQKRIDSKDTFPGLWDVSVAGHIGAGEDLLIAAQREVHEEIGFNVKIKELKFIGNYATDIQHSENLIDREHHHIYIAELTSSIEKLKLQVEEVSEIRLISISKLNENLDRKNQEIKFVGYSLDYFTMVFEAIQEVIKGKKP